MLKYEMVINKIHSRLKSVRYKRHGEYHRIDGAAYIHPISQLTWDRYGREYQRFYIKTGRYEC